METNLKRLRRRRINENYVKPDFEKEYKELLVEDPFKVGTNEMDIEEIIIDKNKGLYRPLLRREHSTSQQLF